jgi:signal transduction histidine kinase
MKPGLSPEDAAVHRALEAWRRTATDTVLAATAALHLGAVALAMFGYSPTLSLVTKQITLGAYAVMVACALLRRIDGRARLLMFFSAAYLVVFLANLVNSAGPYSQIALVAHPVFILVLAGRTAARAAIATSAAILLAAPVVGTIPAVVRVLELAPEDMATATRYLWFHVASLGAFLFTLLILLDRFHRFLLDALAGQFRATATLELEVAERTAAQRRMEDEMRERQRLEREMAVVGDEERRRLGQELHDGVCQQMTAALLRCQALQHGAARGDAVSFEAFEPLTTLLTETIDDAHDVAKGLCPLDADPDALAPALRSLARRTQELADVHCEFAASGDVRVVNPGAAQHLYRIGQEAVSNAVRHARASRIGVELSGTAGHLILQVEDNGVGLPADRDAGGLGLRTMASRARTVGGDLEVGSVPGGGTRVTCRVPRLISGYAPPEHAGDARWLPST